MIAASAGGHAGRHLVTGSGACETCAASTSWVVPAVNGGRPAINSEVHDERVPAREQHVVRLDVAMRDAVRVGVGERVHDLHEDLHRVVDRQLAVPVEPVAQRLAFHVRHHIVEEPARLA